MLAPVLRAAIFDLDGLLVDSEPLWRRAEIEHFATVGLHLTDAECEETTGLRIDEVVAFRHRQHPWGAPSVAEITSRIVDRMVSLLREEAPAKPGGAHAVDLCARAGLRLAVASSSPLRLIEAALARLGLRERFELVVSAEREPYGKPHPAVFLRTAEQLGIAPTSCLVFEDSLNGLVAAKAARMACIAVPERTDARFALADLVLPSLDALDARTLGTMIERVR
ncbi:2-deoxyglucose-6-phosphate hydrolase YniC [Sandaracinus amylolyticus]|uniref:2-deoxyglucose-6-phosphate hydrolase YniC n=2 Tax=Sandaracinus amylolyticus TaxID=927083 RepID=A0A0F6SEW8_9BACT|nr:2-deoxyglucose-6-phosphate hydrolase YniC [Sandaracinus amylolyticus]